MRNIRLVKALKEMEEARLSLKTSEKFEVMQHKIDELEKQNKILENLLERFCVKSNGVSMFARADWKSVEKHKKDVMSLYRFQCVCEDYLRELDKLNEESIQQEINNETIKGTFKTL